MISIIIPAYNCAQYIGQCLHSIGAQVTGEDVEAIVVDDASTDGTADVIAAFVSAYRGRVTFRTLRHAVNRGVSAARNTGLEAARGEYIGFVDSDDYVAPEMYARLLAVLRSWPQRVGMAACRCQVVDVEQAEQREQREADGGAIRYVAAEDFAGEVLPWRMSVAVWDKLFRREVIGGVRFREGCLNEDSLFFLDLLPAIEQGGYGVAVLPERLYCYRVRPNSLSRRGEHSIRIDNLLNMEYIMEALADRKEVVAAMRARRLEELLALLTILGDSRHAEHGRYGEFYQRLEGYTDEEARQGLREEGEYEVYVWMRYFAGAKVAANHGRGG